MKRVVALAVLVSFVGVPVAQAQERRFTPKPSVTFLQAGTPDAPAAALSSGRTPDQPRLGSKASIEKAAAAARGTTAPVVPRRRNVLGKAWFWALIGGAAIVILIWAAGGDDNGDGY